MKKQTRTFTLSILAAAVAALSVGCASTGYARYDDPDTDAMGVSAGAEVGEAEADVRADVDLNDDDMDLEVNDDIEVDVNDDVDVDVDRDYVIVDEADYDRDTRYDIDAEAEAAANSTVSALSFAPETRATWVNKFPFYDWNMAVVETYTFAVPDPEITVTASSELPTFSEDLEPGSVFVEAAGGAGEITAGRVIRHSPTPTR